MRGEERREEEEKNDYLNWRDVYKCKQIYYWINANIGRGNVGNILHVPFDSCFEGPMGHIGNCGH